MLRALTKWGWPARYPLVQFPNPPLIVALLASLAGGLTDGKTHDYATAVYYLALGIWAYEEARHGDNRFRRLLGLGFSVYLVVELAASSS